MASGWQIWTRRLKKTETLQPFQGHSTTRPVEWQADAELAKLNRGCFLLGTP